MSDIKNLKEDSETSPISPKEDENYEEENNPKLVDMIPVFSQVKSFIQWTRGDSSRARRTQQNFSRQCPGISQVRSLVEVAKEVLFVINQASCYDSAFAQTASRLDHSFDMTYVIESLNI
ncbi:hypothetical protein MAR_035653 [Mya arenaria]|uniref:Uncharacterized protein n=1 Tax=Mya arenaria TaxID=6604 RepID=A0ABY7ENI2_MYAAR|nr:hypothetical protein MAR_035653 [Mya arenaria]